MEPIVIDTSFFLPDQQFFTQSIGYNETLLHTHTFFELFFVDSGKAIHNINGKNETVQQNDLVFLRPQDVHTFKYIKPNNFYHTDILFTEELFYKVYFYDTNLFLFQRNFSKLNCLQNYIIGFCL